MDFSTDDKGFQKLMGRMAQKKKGPNHFYLRQSFANLKPTGREFIISGEDAVSVAEDFAAEIGGAISRNKKHIKMPDGTFWFCRIPG
jgi:hypothetical protein